MKSADMGRPGRGKKKKKTSSEQRGPELFSGFGKIAKGLLRNGYNYDKTLSLSTKRFSGVNIVARTHGRLTSVGVGTKYNFGNAALDLIVDDKSFSSAALTYNGKLLPSANVSALFKFPDYKNAKISTTLMYRGKHLLPTELAASLKLPDDGNNKVKVQCLQRYAAFAMSVALKRPPLVKLSSTIGTRKMAIGMEATYQALPFCFMDWQAGFSISNCRFIAALIMADKGDHCRVSCSYYSDKSMKTAAVAEIAAKLSEKTLNFAVGGSCMINHLRMKGKVDNQGKIEVLIQHKIKHKSSVMICCEYDFITLYKMPRIGIAVALVL